MNTHDSPGILCKHSTPPPRSLRLGHNKKTCVGMRASRPGYLMFFTVLGNAFIFGTFLHLRDFSQHPIAAKNTPLLPGAGRCYKYQHFSHCRTHRPNNNGGVAQKHGLFRKQEHAITSADTEQNWHADCSRRISSLRAHHSEHRFTFAYAPSKTR